MYSTIGAAPLDGGHPQIWFADVFDRIAGHPASRRDELLHWNWQSRGPVAARA